MLTEMGVLIFFLIIFIVTYIIIKKFATKKSVNQLLLFSIEITIVGWILRDKLISTNEKIAGLGICFIIFGLAISIFSVLLKNESNK